MLKLKTIISQRVRSSFYNQKNIFEFSNFRIMEWELEKERIEIRERMNRNFRMMEVIKYE